MELEEEDGEVQIAYFEGGNFQKFIHHERIFYRKFNHRRSEDLWLILEFSCATIGPWNILIDFFAAFIWRSTTGIMRNFLHPFCTINKCMTSNKNSKWKIKLKEEQQKQLHYSKSPSFFPKIIDSKVFLSVKIWTFGHEKLPKVT